MDLNFSGTTGETVTAQLYNGTATQGTPIAMTEIATTGEYCANVPAGTPAARYLVVITSGGAKAGSGILDWDGAAEVRPATQAQAQAIAQAVTDKTGYSLTAAYDGAKAVPSAAQIATAVQAGLLDETDGQKIIEAIVAAIGNNNIDQIALVAAIRADIERAGGQLATRASQASIDALPAAPVPPGVDAIAAAVRQNLQIELGRMDAAVSTRSTLARQDLPAVLTAADVWAHTARTLTQAPAVLTTDQAEQLRKLAQLSGVGVPLVVTATQRTAGDVSQTISTGADGTTTVSAA